MARLIVVLLALLPLACSGQDEHFKLAGVCGRCHVISVVEWAMSKHRAVGTGCTECHGVSQGHVIDERNNIKPEKLPHGQAIAGFCNSCHQAGCPKSKQKVDCQKCHHVHALVDPNRPATVSAAFPAAPLPARRAPGFAICRARSPSPVWKWFSSMAASLRWVRRSGLRRNRSTRSA